MRGVRNEALKAEAIRLRVEERLSLREISKRISVPMSTASVWLKPYPLTDSELSLLMNTASRTAAGRKKPRLPESKFFPVVELDKLSTSQKGRIAEAAVLFRLALRGYEVFSSQFEGSKCDFLVRRIDGKIRRLQVKWASEKHWGLPQVVLTCSNGHSARRRYAHGELDILVAYHLQTDTAYVFSEEELVSIKAVLTVYPEAAERWDKL